MTVTQNLESTQAGHDALTGLKLIDCDAHYTEPPDLWASRASASVRDKMPQQRTVDGVTAWYYEDQMWASTGGNTLHRGRGKVPGILIVQPFENIDPAAWSLKDRLALMDQYGIYAQVIYPNGVGFSSNHIFAIPDLDDRLTVMKIYNDHFADLFRDSGGRLVPQALLPIWDMDETVREMSRLLDLGIRGFTITDRPELLGLPELGRPYFDPMWDLFNQSQAVTNFHVGAGMSREDLESRRHARNKEARPEDGDFSDGPPAVADANWREFGHQRRLAVASTLGVMSNVRIIANLVMSDLFDRYPKLRIVSAESGVGWIPFVLESLEFQSDEMITNDTERRYQKRRPTEYFRDHIFAMFWFETYGPRNMIHQIGAKNILLETDIPHPTSLFPFREHFAEVFENVPADDVRRIVQDNAAELYSIDLTMKTGS